MTKLRIAWTARLRYRRPMEILILYAGIGIVAGLMAGLLGVGGGVVIVPLLVGTFSAQGMPLEHVQRLAVGTSLATIIFTAISSGLSHHLREAVMWPVVQRLATGIVIGTLGGSCVAARLPTATLQLIFAIFLVFVAVQMLLDRQPRATHRLPGVAGLSGVGAGIGLLSSLVGVGGGALTVPFLSRCNVPMHLAIGTSAVVGLPIAVAGTVGYIINGWSQPTLPPGSLGYVYIPALIGIAGASAAVAPMGARLAHQLPTRPLKRGFAVFVALVAVRMVVGALSGGG